MTASVVTDEARRRARHALAVAELKRFTASELGQLHGQALSKTVPFATIARRLRWLADEVERRDTIISEI